MMMVNKTIRRQKADCYKNVSVIPYFCFSTGLGVYTLFSFVK